MAHSPRTWILFRGLGRETGHWNGFVEEVEREFSNDQILTLDLPGAGEFRHDNCPLSLRKMVKFLREKVLEKDPQYPLHFFGVSLGGMVAMEWMRQSPMQVHGGILVNTSISNLNPFYERLRWECYLQFFTKNAFLKGKDRELAILDVISNHHAIHEEVAEDWKKIAEERPIDTINVGRQLFAASHFRLNENLKPKVVLMVGQGDRLVNPNCSEELHEKFGWPIYRHPWAGHDLTLDDPAWVLEQMKEF